MCLDIKIVFPFQHNFFSQIMKKRFMYREGRRDLLEEVENKP